MVPQIYAICDFWDQAKLYLKSVVVCFLSPISRLTTVSYLNIRSQISLLVKLRRAQPESIVLINATCFIILVVNVCSLLLQVYL